MESTKVDLEKVAEWGEESGREEASADFPFLPRNPSRRVLTRRGRARAQGLYGLHGKAARVFARKWAMGYDANVSLYEEDYPEELASARNL